MVRKAAKSRVINKIPSQESLEERFSFIESDILKSNLGIALRYIVFLLTLLHELELPGALYYSIYKDIIIYTASVVESCIHYCVKQYLEKGVIRSKDVMPWKWVNDRYVVLHTTSNGKEVCGIIRYKKSGNFTDKTQFKTVNEVAKRAGILTNSLFEKSESLRKKRNKVHLAALREVDDYYSERDIQSAFNTAKEVIERVEKKLWDLSRSNTSQSSQGTADSLK